MMRAIAADAGVHEDFDPVESRLRCFAHILHLAAQAGMDALKMPDVDEDIEVEDGDGNVLKKVSEFLVARVFVSQPSCVLA